MRRQVLRTVDAVHLSRLAELAPPDSGWPASWTIGAVLVVRGIFYVFGQVSKWLESVLRRNGRAIGRRVGWSQKQRQSLKPSQAKQAPAIPPGRRLVVKLQGNPAHRAATRVGEPIRGAREAVAPEDEIHLALAA